MKEDVWISKSINQLTTCFVCKQKFNGTILKMDDKTDQQESCTLFVGEGDFSYSMSYIVKSKDCYEKIYASCLSNQPLTERQQKNIKIIIDNGGFIFTDVDATQLEHHPRIKELKFSKIIFNFPHIPGKMNIRKNRHLMENFFLSSKKVLKTCGTLIVTLCQGQGGTEIETVKRKWSDSWQIVGLATSASLLLYRVQPFDTRGFEMYRCTGFRGLEKPFNMKGALMHIFKHGDSVCINNTIKNYLDADLYLQNCKVLYRNIYTSSSQPCLKIAQILNNVAAKVFHSMHQETIWDLITCGEPSLLTLDINEVDINLCEGCIKNVLSLVLDKKCVGNIISIETNVCCTKNININKFPFAHINVYFSDDVECILNSLETFLKELKEIYITDNKLFIHSDTFVSNKIIHSVAQSTINWMSVKSILNLYATYAVNQGDELFYYSDVDFHLLRDNELNSVNHFKFGSVFECVYNLKKYICIFFDITVLCFLKYHIMDYRILFSENSFYSPQVINGCHINVYRPHSLYPPIYIHDVSFYIDDEFCENELFLTVRNAVGYLIKSVTLIDSYYDEKVKKHSKCYRFMYESYDKVLSRDNANEIHSKFVRKILEKSLNIYMR